MAPLHYDPPRTQAVIPSLSSVSKSRKKMGGWQATAAGTAWLGWRLRRTLLGLKRGVHTLKLFLHCAGTALAFLHLRGLSVQYEERWQAAPQMRHVMSEK